MKLVKQSEVHDIVRKSLDDALSTEQIGHINDLLTSATYRYNAEGGLPYIAIHAADIPNSKDFPLTLLASMLCAHGWKAKRESCQRDGEWVHVDLPRVNR